MHTANRENHSHITSAADMGNYSPNVIDYDHLPPAWFDYR